MDPIITYLRNDELPEGNIEAHILRLKAAHYVLYDNKLYQRGYSMSLLKCIPLSEAEYIIREIHEGICGNHARGQSLTFKTLRSVYYWPTVKTDYLEFGRKCDKCQQFSPVSKAHPEELTSITSPWPFVVWGIDLFG